MRRLAIITACLLLWALCRHATAAGVQLVNGDFEAVAGGVPVGWHYDSPGSAGGVGVRVETLQVRSGKRALTIPDPDNKGYGVESRLYPAVAGQRYRASAWVYNGVGDQWLYLEFYADSANRVVEKHLGCGKTGSWQPIAIEGVCPATARYVAVELYSGLANVGESAWDDVTLAGPAGAGDALALDKPREEPKVDYSPLCAVGDRKQLLFDDAFLESHKGFWWRVCPPRKTGERNLVSDRPWESFLINWFSVMEDGGRYRMWYEAYDKSAGSDEQARYCYAESQDGIHWAKPTLGLVTFNGSRQNNILFDRLGGLSNHGGTVFVDPQAPKRERYKVIYLGQVKAGGPDYRVCAGHSADGIHWHRYTKAPILDVSSDTQQACFWDDSLGKYVAYCRLWTPNRTVGRSESKDFLAFPPAVEVLGCDSGDPADTDLYNSAAMKYPYAANAYFIFTSTYHHGADNVDVQLAVSRDGVHWSRPERKPFVANGAPGSLDDATIYVAPGLIRTGDELWQYYFADRARHNQVAPQWLSRGGTYSRMIIKLDRYVAMDASAMPAEFTSRPLTFTGNRLEINADARPRGEARFELQDAAGKPIPGFTLQDCRPLAGDSLRHVVTWKGGADLSSLAGKPVRLHCVAHDTSLYAFQFAKP